MTPAPPRGAKILRLYPRSWRVRYGPEVMAMLELMDVGWREQVDLARGAIDAHLHAPRLAAAAAFVTGALWTGVGTGVVLQPAPPDWPGHLVETLPLAIAAVVVGAVATIGCWARQSDRMGRVGAVVGIGVVIAHGMWAIALAAALLDLGYGAITALAQDIGALAVLVVGLMLLRFRDEPIGALLVLAPTVLLFGWPVGWLVYGLAWTIVGAMLVIGAGDESAGAIAA